MYKVYHCKNRRSNYIVSMNHVNSDLYEYNSNYEEVFSGTKKECCDYADQQDEKAILVK